MFPSRILRQLYLCFLCAQPSDDGEGWNAIRSFIRSKEPVVPTEAPRVALYYNPLSTYRIVPVCSVGTVDGTGRNWVGSEIAAPGLGVVFSLGDREKELSRLLDVAPVDITQWGAKPFDRRESLTLELPRLIVQEPHPLGFGRHAEFERWQTKNMIVWLVAESQYPGSLTATAALWRIRPR